MMKRVIIISFLLTLVVSCTKTPEFHDTNYTIGGGVFVVNEGNFRSGNGSLSFISLDSSKVYNDLFFSKNGRPLGDVPYQMVLKDEKGYVIVNNSGKIEVIEHTTVKSLGTINGLISPRQMAIIDDTKAYVSSLYSDSLAIIRLSDNSVNGYINLRRTSEAIAAIPGKAFVSSWVGGHEVMVINTFTNKIIDSISVGTEPESMVLDKFNKLWVLCNGGWARENFAELYIINTGTNKVEKKFTFSSKLESPICLQIDGLGQNLYFLDDGVRKMEINATALPGSAFIPQINAQFYKIGVNPANGDILVSDAGDYTQPGTVSIYKADGTFLTKYRAGIIPGSMCFNIRVNTVIQ